VPEIETYPEGAQLSDGSMWSPRFGENNDTTSASSSSTVDPRDWRVSAFEIYKEKMLNTLKDVDASYDEEQGLDMVRREWEGLGEDGRWAYWRRHSAIQKDEELLELKLTLEGQVTEEQAFHRMYPHMSARGPDRVQPRITLSSQCSVKGRRSYHEDATVFGGVSIDGRVVSYAAVLDGHGGANCSRSVAKVFEKLVKAIPLPEGRVYPEKLADILREHFRAFGESLKKKRHFSVQGSTMCAMVAIDDTVYFINLGDSIAAFKLSNGASWYKLIDQWLDPEMYKQAMADKINDSADQWIRYTVPKRSDNIYKTTKIHSPVRDSMRIQEAGGFVSFGRLNGNLAVSRSLGDGWVDEITSRDPEVYWAHRSSFDSPFVLLASDGIYEPYTLWSDNPMTPEHAIQHIHCLYDQQLHLPDIAETIARSVFRLNSHDNISLMVLRLWPISRDLAPSNEMTEVEYNQKMEGKGKDPLISYEMGDVTTPDGNDWGKMREGLGPMAGGPDTDQ